MNVDLILREVPNSLTRIKGFIWTEFVLSLNDEDAGSSTVMTGFPMCSFHIPKHASNSV